MEEEEKEEKEEEEKEEITKTTNSHTIQCSRCILMQGKDEEWWHVGAEMMA